MLFDRVNGKFPCANFQYVSRCLSNIHVTFGFHVFSTQTSYMVLRKNNAKNHCIYSIWHLTHLKFYAAGEKRYVLNIVRGGGRRNDTFENVGAERKNDTFHVDQCYNFAIQCMPKSYRTSLEMEYSMSYGYTAALKELDVFHLLAFDVIYQFSWHSPRMLLKQLCGRKNHSVACVFISSYSCSFFLRNCNTNGQQQQHRQTTTKHRNDN